MKKYKSATSDMKHQILAKEAARNTPDSPSAEDVFAYLMDYGTGKSKVILDEWGEKATSGGPMDLLVLAPAGNIRNWYVDKGADYPSEVRRHMDESFRDALIYEGWKTGGGSTHKKRLEYLLRTQDPKRPRALFVNIEALSSVKRVRDLCMEFVTQRCAEITIDESTVIKNPKSQRSKFVYQLGEQAVTRRIATGLLTPQSPMDAFGQFMFLDWKILGAKSMFSFRGRYAITRQMESGGRRFDVVVGYRNLDDLRDRIAPYSYRVLKSECLDLEPKKYVLWEVEHTAEQKRMYQELKEFACAQVNEAFVSTEHVMTLVMRLHQINCGFVKDESGVEHEIPSNRIKDLVQILGQHNGKAVVWTPYVQPLLKIKEALDEEFGEGKTAMFYGGNKSTRHIDEKRFLSDPDCKFMLATQGAAGRGNTWVNADLEVYFANDNDLEKRYNSEDRLHRKGQKNRVTIVDMIVPDTVDMKIVHRLRKKIDIATTLTGEEARSWLI